jgi:hypothetical protein
MSTQTQSDDMREKMQMIKTAYGSRHYTQCAKHGERMLADVKGDVSAYSTNLEHNHVLTIADPPHSSGLPQLLHSTIPRHTSAGSNNQEPLQGTQTSRKTLHGRYCCSNTAENGDRGAFIAYHAYITYLRGLRLPRPPCFVCRVH